MEQIFVKILTAIVTKLLTEKIVISLALNGIARYRGRSENAL